MFFGSYFKMADVNMARKRKSASLETNNLDAPGEISSDDAVQTISDDECVAPVPKCAKIHESAEHNLQPSKASTSYDKDCINLTEDVCDVDSSSDGVTVQDGEAVVRSDDDDVQIVDDNDGECVVDNSSITNNMSNEDSGSNDDDVTVVTENTSLDEHKTNVVDVDTDEITVDDDVGDNVIDIDGSDNVIDIDTSDNIINIDADDDVNIDNKNQANTADNKRNNLSEGTTNHIATTKGIADNKHCNTKNVSPNTGIECNIYDQAKTILLEDDISNDAVTTNNSSDTIYIGNVMDSSPSDDLATKQNDSGSDNNETTNSVNKTIDLNSDISEVAVSPNSQTEIDVCESKTNDHIVDTKTSAAISQTKNVVIISDIKLQTDSLNSHTLKVDTLPEIPSENVGETETPIQQTDVCSDNLTQTDKAIITITFSTKDVLNLYQTKFMSFIQKFAELTYTVGNNQILVEHNDCEVDSEDGSTTSPVGKSKKRKRKNKTKKELFTLDTDPTEKEYTQAPKYMSKYKVIEPVEEVEPQEAPPRISNSSCFNCAGNHNLSECPVPKDFRKIQRARQSFRTVQVQKIRYHLDEEGGKYGHLRPGEMSSNLRTALGLGKYDTPMHIYKMRTLGYPPGWLEDAMLHHSNLAMFDIEGKDVVSKKMSGRQNLVDPARVINYPGFNVKMTDGCRDENKMYGVPPFSDIFSKDAMIAYINRLQNKLQDDFETKDMEIDTGSDKEVPPPPGVSEETTQRISPSLVDLESKKEELLAQLQTGDSANNSPAPVETKSATTIKKDLNKTLDNNKSISEVFTPSRKVVKTSTFGTPIIKSSSPFSILPHPENFSKDVSPVINFENLPNSTGKYEQMTNVLDKVRKTLKNIQEST